MTCECLTKDDKALPWFKNRDDGVDPGVVEVSLKASFLWFVAEIYRMFQEV